MHAYQATATGDRAEAFRRVFGTDTVPILSPVPELATLPGYDRPRLVYLLDLERITPEQRARLVEHLSKRFRLPAEEVERDLDAAGMPILVEGVIVTARGATT